MMKAVPLVIAAVLSCTAASTLRERHDEAYDGNYIVNGLQAYPHQFPWQILLEVRSLMMSLKARISCKLNSNSSSLHLSTITATAVVAQLLAINGCSPLLTASTRTLQEIISSQLVLITLADERLEAKNSE